MSRVPFCFSACDQRLQTVGARAHLTEQQICFLWTKYRWCLTWNTRNFQFRSNRADCPSENTADPSHKRLSQLTWIASHDDQDDYFMMRRKIIMSMIIISNGTGFIRIPQKWFPVRSSLSSNVCQIQGKEESHRKGEKRADSVSDFKRRIQYKR